MTAKQQKDKWLKTMIAKHGSEEAVRAEMVRRQQKSMENPTRQKGNHRGGFSDKELAKKAGQKGLETRWGNIPSKEE